MDRYVSLLTYFFLKRQDLFHSHWISHIIYSRFPMNWLYETPKLFNIMTFCFVGVLVATIRTFFLLKQIYFEHLFIETEKTYWIKLRFYCLVIWTVLHNVQSLHLICFKFCVKVKTLVWETKKTFAPKLYKLSDEVCISEQRQLD